MSDLQNAIDKWESKLASAHGWDIDHDTMFAILKVNEAARLVADPDIEAAREAVDMTAVVLLLWRLMELMGVSTVEFPVRDVTGFALMIRDSIVNRELLDAALTGDTE